jgi:hypothetical protein
MISKFQITVICYIEAPFRAGLTVYSLLQVLISKCLRMMSHLLDLFADLAC